MDINIKKKKIIFTFETDGEEHFIFNAINFSINIILHEKVYASKMSKEMLSIIEKIEKKFETGSLLERLDENNFSAEYKDILILFDNTIFIIEALKEDPKIEDYQRESYDLILNVVKEIVSFIKKETEL